MLESPRLKIEARLKRRMYDFPFMQNCVVLDGYCYIVLALLLLTLENALLSE